MICDNVCDDNDDLEIIVNLFCLVMVIVKEIMKC